MRGLVLTGGIRHDFESNTRILVGHLSDAGIHCETTDDIAAGIRRLDKEQFDLVTVMALRWSMDGDPKYATDRGRYAFRMPEDCQRLLAGFVDAGGGLLGLHTACLCFDDWAGWRELLGGKWSWGRSFHPPVGTVEVRPTSTSNAITTGIGAFTLVDEVYSGLDLADGIDVLLTAHAESAVHDEPVLWCQSAGAGRVVFDGLGHDHRSLADTVHARVLRRAAAWCAGASDTDIERL